MIINSNTKIAALLKQNPEALEAIISISPKFKKLRSPLLRKLMAARTSINMASKVSGCLVDDFFNKLQPFGFEIDRATVATIDQVTETMIPEFFKNLEQKKVIELDVRPVIESGKDPLNIILSRLKEIKGGEVINIINSFEPTPLILLLGKQGFESYTVTISDELVNTYFYKKTTKPFAVADDKQKNAEGWEEALSRFENQLVTIDVRKLEMPLPMHSILEALETLSVEKALFVYHKRIPVFLLPELEERKLSYRIKEISEGEVRLLIYKN